MSSGHDHGHGGFKARKAAKSLGLTAVILGVVAVVIFLLVLLVPIAWRHAMAHDPYDPIPPHVPAVCRTPNPELPAPAGLANPNEQQLAWSCAGILSQWDMSVHPKGHEYPGAFRPYPRVNPWCRVSEPGHPEALEYHRLPRSGNCRSGPLMFLTRPDVDGFWSYWYDPQLRIWLTAPNADIRNLRGDTHCGNTDTWVSIDITDPAGGPFFNAANQSCLKTYNHDHGLKPPASLKLVKTRARLWTNEPGTPNGHRWYDLAHDAPVCRLVYRFNDCETAR